MPRIPEVGQAAVVTVAGTQGITADHCVCAAALMSLKRKKAYEKQIEQIDNSISRVNEQQMMLENQRTTAETVLALQQGVRANKATMQVLVRSLYNANWSSNLALLCNTALWLQSQCFLCRQGSLVYAGVCSGPCVGTVQHINCFHWMLSLHCRS